MTDQTAEAGMDPADRAKLYRAGTPWYLSDKSHTPSLRDAVLDVERTDREGAVGWAKRVGLSPHSVAIIEGELREDQAATDRLEAAAHRSGFRFWVGFLVFVVLAAVGGCLANGGLGQSGGAGCPGTHVVPAGQCPGVGGQ